MPRFAHIHAVCQSQRRPQDPAVATLGSPLRAALTRKAPKVEKAMRYLRTRARAGAGYLSVAAMWQSNKEPPDASSSKALRLLDWPDFHQKKNTQSPFWQCQFSACAQASTLNLPSLISNERDQAPPRPPCRNRGGWVLISACWL